MNREQAIGVFKEYTDHYDSKDTKVLLKIEHSYRVCDIALQIASSVFSDDKDIELAWFMGLLHDIGRFEQLRRYGTFLDAHSIDHAELGADILFKDGVIDSFPVEGLTDSLPDWRQIAETAVRMHNKYALSEDMDPEMKNYCDILRDADKCDIFRVIMTEPPYLERNQRILSGSADGSVSAASEEVMRFVKEHRCVAKELVKTDFEGLICQSCMAFELACPISRDIVYEQGYLHKLLTLPVEDDAMLAQLKLLRDEIKRAWEGI